MPMYTVSILLLSAIKQYTHIIVTINGTVTRTDFKRFVKEEQKINKKCMRHLQVSMASWFLVNFKRRSAVYVFQAAITRFHRRYLLCRSARMPKPHSFLASHQMPFQTFQHLWTRRVLYANLAFDKVSRPNVLRIHMNRNFLAMHLNKAYTLASISVLHLLNKDCKHYNN